MYTPVQTKRNVKTRFLYPSINDAATIYDDTAQNVKIIYELAGIWKEAIVACLKVLSWHSPGRTGKNHEKIAVRIIR
jgi:hypothetical protein